MQLLLKIQQTSTFTKPYVKLQAIWFQMHAVCNSGRHSKLSRTFDAPLGFTVQICGNLIFCNKSSRVGKRDILAPQARRGTYSESEWLWKRVILQLRLNYKIRPINIDSEYPQYSIPELGQWMGLCRITHFSITCQIMQIKDCLCLYMQPPCVLKCRVNKLPQITEPR